MKQIKEPTNVKTIKEIDIINYVRKVLKNRKSLLVSLVTGFIIGIVIALNNPKSFTADVVLAPEISSGGLGISGNLADMASSFGLDIGNTGKSMDALYPEIYPEILSSDDFILTLFDVPVRLKDDDTPRSYFQHLIKDTKFPFWDYPKKWIALPLKPKYDINKCNKNDILLRMKKKFSGSISLIDNNKFVIEPYYRFVNIRRKFRLLV